MTPWDKKLQQFEALLEQRLSEHNSTVSTVRGNLQKHANDAAAVQARLLLEFALCNPPLSAVRKGKYDTIFDMISANVVDSLVEFGTEYLDNADTD